MKVKRFSNLWLMGIILCFAILVAIYIFKIFFPTIVIEVAQIESITRIGHYIDTHKWAWYIANITLSIINLYIYCCACSSQTKLSIRETIVVVSIVLFAYLIKAILPNYFTTINYIIMVVTPLITKGCLKNTAICFSMLNILQILTLEIRGIGLLVSDFNFATLLILMIDYYIFTIFLYLYFNFKRRKLWD